MSLISRLVSLFVKSGTVLVIEDDPVQRLWIQRTVKIPGIRVIVPDTCDETQDMIGVPIDLLVLDRHMSNGWKAAKERAIEYYRGRCPIWEHTVDSTPPDDASERHIVKGDPGQKSLVEQIREWFLTSERKAD